SLGILAVGIAYSLGFRGGEDRTMFRLKSLFICKHLSIGGGRAPPALGGAGRFGAELVLVAVFVAVQVFVGSALRDFPDVVEDQLTGVKTFPGVFARAVARRSLSRFTLASATPLAVPAGVCHAPVLAALLPAATLWRAMTL